MATGGELATRALFSGWVEPITCFVNLPALWSGSRGMRDVGWPCGTERASGRMVDADVSCVSVLFRQPLESSTMLSDNDGVCNSMPGWNPLSIWNPRDYHEDPDCRLNPMYQQRGMGVGASYGGKY